MQELGTGYKPQWGLGAVLAALNDTTKEQFNQEDLLKSILANQREQQSMPLDMDIKAQEAQMARAKMADPDYAKWALQNMIGQGKIVGAQGDIAQATLPQTIQNKQQDLRTSGLMGNLNEALAKLKQNALQGQGNGTIGFGMRPQQQQQPTAGFSWQIPQEVQQSRDADRLAILQEELKDHPTDQNLLRAIETTKSKVGTKAPAQSMQTDNPVYEQIMQSLMDTPDFRRDIQKQNLITDRQMQLQELRNQGILQRQKAQAKATDIVSQAVAGKLSYEKAATALTLMASQEADPEAKEMYLNMAKAFGEEVLKKPAVGQTGRVDIEKTTEGAVPTIPKPVSGLGKDTSKKETSNKEELKKRLQGQ